jgi:hypothetical protein
VLQEGVKDDVASPYSVYVQCRVNENVARWMWQELDPIARRMMVLGNH